MKFLTKHKFVISILLAISLNTMWSILGKLGHGYMPFVVGALDYAFAYAFVSLIIYTGTPYVKKKEK